LRGVIFFLLLPEPIPFPDGEIFSFVGEPHASLSTYGWMQTREVGPAPEEAEGRLFTSLRFWQIPVKWTDSIDREYELINEAIRRAVPAAVLEETRADGEDSDEDVPTESELMDAMRAFGIDDADVDKILSKPPSHYATVVEAVTALVPVEGPPDVMSDAFDRCVDALTQLVGAYRRAAIEPIAAVTRERLPAAVYYLTFRLSEPKTDWSHGLFLAHMSASQMFERDLATREQVEDIKRQLRAELGNHPLTPNLDRAVDARYALRMGDTANAVVLAQVAAEIFLDALLGLLLWEEGVAPAAAYATLSIDLTRRVRTEYASRLGGDWNVDGSGAVGSWRASLYQLRGRVIHADYLPSRSEARVAIEALEGLVEYCMIRLTQRVSRYPIAALVLVGPIGLEARGGWARQIREFAADNADNTWLRDYRRWRTEADGES
jgi:hypothetical protein